MITLMLMLITPFLANNAPDGFNFIDDYTISYIINSEKKAVVSLDWILNTPADSILVCRGDQILQPIAGTATHFEIIESDYGEFQYTICWKKHGVVLQYETAILPLGKLTFDPPANPVDGYYIYVELEPNEPNHDSLKYETTDTQVSLSTLKAAGLLIPGAEYRFAVASYVEFKTEKLVSELTDSISALYLDLTIPWALPKQPESLKVEF